MSAALRGGLSINFARHLMKTFEFRKDSLVKKSSDLHSGKAKTEKSLSKHQIHNYFDDPSDN